MRPNLFRNQEDQNNPFQKAFNNYVDRLPNHPLQDKKNEREVI